MDLNIPLAVSVGNSAIMIGAIFFGAGRLKQSVVGIQGGLNTATEKLAELDDKVDKMRVAVAYLQGAQEERNRQGA